MAREDRLSYINLGKGLCKAVTASGSPCQQLRGHCPYHAEEGHRCESCLDARPKRRCQLPRLGKSRYCECHATFPNLGKVLQEHIRAEGAPVHEDKFFAAHYPAGAGQFCGSFQALVEALKPPASVAVPEAHIVPEEAAPEAHRPIGGEIRG